MALESASDESEALSFPLQKSIPTDDLREVGEISNQRRFGVAPSAQSLQGLSQAFLIAAAIAGIMTAVCGYVATMYANRASDLAQAEAMERIAKAQADAAAANARTAEAELSLEQLKKKVAPRKIDQKEFVSKIEAGPKMPVQVLYVRDDPECMSLANQIVWALRDAGWPIIGSQSSATPLPVGTGDKPSAMGLHGQPTGVSVVPASLSLQETAALGHALRGKEWVRTPWTVLSYAIGSSLQGVSSGTGGGGNPPPAGTLRVVVAPKANLN